MRRVDRQVTDVRALREIMQRCDAVTLAFAGDTPYAVPVSFGFEEEEGRFALYIHCAMEGEKLRRMEANPRCAFSMYTGTRLIEGDAACAYSTTYESVCGNGVLTRLEGEDKRRGIAALMRHYAPGRALPVDEQVLARTCVLRLDVEQLCGKRRM